MVFGVCLVFYRGGLRDNARIVATNIPLAEAFTGAPLNLLAPAPLQLMCMVASVAVGRYGEVWWDMVPNVPFPAELVKRYRDLHLCNPTTARPGRQPAAAAHHSPHAAVRYPAPRKPSNCSFCCCPLAPLFLFAPVKV